MEVAETRGIESPTLKDQNSAGADAGGATRRANPRPSTAVAEGPAEQAVIPLKRACD